MLWTPKVCLFQAVKESTIIDLEYDVSPRLTDSCKAARTFFTTLALTLGLLAAVPVLYAFSGSDITTESDFKNEITLGDVDGDNDLDLIVGYRNRPIRLYLNDGLGNYDIGSDITAEAFDTLAVSLGDVDGDGDLDLVSGNVSHCNRLYINNGIGNFATGGDITTDNYDTYDIELGDVDGDGDLDLIAGNLAQANRLYLNDGAGNFSAGSNITEDTFETLEVALSDVDGDGDLDLIVEEAKGGNFNSLHLNDGTGRFDAGIQVHSVSVPQTRSPEEIRTVAADSKSSSVTILVPVAYP